MDKRKIMFWIIGAIILILIVLGLVSMVRSPGSLNQQKGILPPSPKDIGPEAVLNMEKVLERAYEIYALKKKEGADFSSGPCISEDLFPEATRPEDKWVVDIAHNPREAIDNLEENQCANFREGRAKHFVELDLDGVLIKAL